MINASEADLEAASSSCEFWEGMLAALVVFSVIAEFGIGWIHPSYDSWLEHWGSTIADAGIALGIVGEVRSSRKDGRIQTQLRKRSNANLAEANERVAQLEFESGFAEERVAEALERAAVAERETEKLRSEFGWRFLSSDAAKFLEVELGKIMGGYVRISHMEDPESQNFALQIIRAFERTKRWRITTIVGSFWSLPSFGIKVSAEGETASRVIQAALAAARIEFEIGDPPDFSSANVSTRPSNIVASGSHAGAMFIGPKPMPNAP